MLEVALTVRICGSACVVTIGASVGSVTGCVGLAVGFCVAGCVGFTVVGCGLVVGMTVVGCGLVVGGCVVGAAASATSILHVAPLLVSLSHPLRSSVRVSLT